MDDVITIFIDANTKAFKKGTQAVKTAVESLNKTTKQFTGRAISSFKRLIPLVAGVGSVFGILSKGVSTYMSQHEELGKKMNAVWTTIGNLIGPIIEKIVDLIATLTSYFVGLLNVFGVTSKKASELSKSTGAVQKTLAGFDELNVLQDNSGSGSLDDKALPNALSEIAELLKNKMWDEAADLIIDKLNTAISKIHEKAIELGDKLAEPFQGITHVIARVLDETNWKELGAAIADFFNHLFQEIDGLNIGEDLGKILVAPFTIGFKILTGFLETLDWARFGTIISEGIKGALGSITKAIEEADFQKIGAGIKAFFENIDWEGIKNKIIELFKTMWNAAVDFLKGLIMGDDEEDPPTIGALRKLGESIAKFGDTVSELFGDVWQDIKTAISDIMQSEAVASIIESIAKAIDWVGKMCKEHKDVVIGIIEGVGIAIATYKIAKSIMDIVSAVGALVNPTNIIIAVIASVIGYLVHLYLTNDEFREKVNAAWEKIKTVVGTVVDWIQEKWETFKEKISGLGDKFGELKEKTSGIWDGIKTALGGAVDWILEKWEKLKESIGLLKQKFEEQGVLKTLWGGIKDGITTASEGIVKKFTELKDGLGSVKDKFEELKKGASEKWEGLKKVLHVDEIKTKLVEGFGKIKDNVVEKLTKLKTDAVSTTTRMKNDIEKTYAEIGKKMEELKKKYEDMTKLVKDKNSELSDSVEQDFAKIAKLIEESAQKCLEAMQKSFLEIKKKVEEGATASINASRKLKDEMTKSFTDISNNSTKLISTMQTNVTKNTTTMSTSVTGTMSKLKSEMERNWEAIKNKATTLTQSMTNDIKTKYTAMCNNLNQATTTLSNNMQNAFNRINTTVTTAIRNMTSSVGTMMNNMANVTTNAMNTMSNAVSNAMNSISNSAYNGMSNFTNAVSNGMSNAVNTVSNAASEMSSTMSNALSDTANQANTYGSDMSNNFANGVESESTQVTNATKSIAGKVKKLIGFSEPEEGPLSDFHTYGPDMMKLYADTIMKSRGTLFEAVEKVAGGVSDRIDKIDANFGANFSALEGIANNVNWKMPAVAGGGIVPYGVSSGVEASTNGNASVVDAVDRLSKMISDLQYSLENMQWVAQFGSVRAFVRECKKVERQMQRAEG